jgi:prepilin-type N-terminal cleavage/methylation domain-containing protein
MSTARSRAERRRAGLNAVAARMRRDDGFTLIELLIGTVIIGIIIGAIAQALVVGFTTTGDTSQRFSESHDAQIASGWLARDVQGSIRTRITNADCTGGMTNLISFSTAADGSNPYASYCYGTSSGQTQVTRRSAAGSQVLVHFAGSGTPNVTCDPGCASPTGPNKVQIQVTEQTGYTFTVLGARRAWNTSGGSGGTSAPPLTLLAFGNSPLTIHGKCTGADIHNMVEGCEGETGASPGAALLVNGNLYVNSAVNGAVRIIGNNPGGGLKALTTPGFYMLSGGTCVGCGAGKIDCQAGCPPPTFYSPAYLDPLRFMTAPTGTTPGSCSGVTCTPGVYNSTLTVQSNTTLNPGIYILKSGMTVNAGANLTGNGVMLFNQGGSMTFNGNSTISLTSSNVTGDPYKGILIFQPASNSSALKLSGGVSVNPAAFDGVVYAPQASSVTLGTGGATMHVTAVMAQNIIVQGNSRVTLG